MFTAIILLIALAWIGWLVAWSRDRKSPGVVLSGGFGPAPLRPAPTRLSAPRTDRMARRRRREVLGALATLAVLTFLLGRVWSPMWLLHGLTDMALLAYSYAVLSIERPDALAQLRASFAPTTSPEHPVDDAGRLEGEQADGAKMPLGVS